MGLSVIISGLTFILLNPFVYTNPLDKTLYMFKHRMIVANSQSGYLPNLRLPTPDSRLKQIYINFFHPDSVSNFNSFYFSPSVSPSWILLLILFLSGILYEIRKAGHGDRRSQMLLVSFAVFQVAMGYYLVIDWPRYYVHLLFYFVLYQSIGLVLYLKMAKQLLLTAINKKRRKFS